jgi:hypothetical protein
MLRRTAMAVLAFALVPYAASADIIRHRDIPAAYLGTWTPGGAACTGADREAVVLAAQAYTSATANCTVDYVSETASPRGPIYSARLRCANPASKAHAKSFINLIIRSDGADRISLGPDFGGLKPYQRCSSGAPAVKQ